MALTTRPRPSWVSLSARTTSATFISDLRFSATGHYPQHLDGPAMHGTMPASPRPTVPIVRMREHRSRRAATDPGRKFPSPGTRSPDCGIPDGVRQVHVVRPRSSIRPPGCPDLGDPWFERPGGPHGWSLLEGQEAAKRGTRFWDALGNSWPGLRR